MKIETDLVVKSKELKQHLLDTELIWDASITQIAAFIEEFLVLGLARIFKNSAAHFKVHLATDSSNMWEIMIQADEVGAYQYYGTAPHSITSDKPMPINGGVAFAQSVSHPGTEPHIDEVNTLIAEAFIAVKATGGGRGLWGF